MLSDQGSQTGGPEGFIKGVEVSYLQGQVHWDKLVTVKAGFASIKATDGATWLDPYFAANWSGAQGVGLTRGAGHLFRMAEDPRIQAEAFCAAVGALAPADLPPVLYFEDEGDDNSSPAGRIQALQTWLTDVEGKLGRRPLLCTSTPFFIATVGNTAQFGAYKLWITRYPADKPMTSCQFKDPLPGPEPSLPSAWPRWTFWRYTAQGQIPGTYSSGASIHFAVFRGAPSALGAL